MLPSPEYLYCELSQSCNLRCEHCRFWEYENRQVLSDDQLADIIGEFAAMGGKTVVTCGGEASLEGERFWNLHRAARDNGLRSFTVTNGTRVTRMNVGRWVTEGPSEVTVSLDSHDPELHDRWRGVPNWHVATRALRTLLDHRVTTKVYAMTIVAERNYRDLPKLFDLVLGDIKADKLKLNIAQMTFGFTKHDDWFAANAPKDPDNLIRVIESCDREWGIKRNRAWLADVAMYCRSVQKNGDALGGRRKVGQTERNICNSAERNIWIGWNGVARLCPSAAWPGAKVKTGADVRAFWENSGCRGDMLACKNYCGISHSVRREPSTLREAA